MELSQLLLVHLQVRHMGIPLAQLHVLIFAGQSLQYFLSPFFHDLTEIDIACEPDHPDQLLHAEIMGILVLVAESYFLLQPLGVCIQLPINGFEVHFVLETGEVNANVLGDPLLLQHCDQLLLDVHLVVQPQPHLLLPLQDLLVLVFEQNGAEAVQLWQQVNDVLLGAHRQMLKERGQNFIVLVQQLHCDCRVKGNIHC